MKIIRQNVSLIVILVLSLWLSIIGLFPNTLLGQHEPGFIAPADQIIKNFILEGNIDPNVQPHPFKYSTTAFYIQSLLRGGTLLFFYQTNKLTGNTFGLNEKYFEVENFSEFALGNGGFLLSDHLLWISRLYGVFFGVGCVFLTYLITSQLFMSKLNKSANRMLSLLASLSLAVMPLHVRYSHYAIVDISQVFFFLLSFLISLKILNNPNYKYYAWAGFFVGFSTSLKYFPLALVPFLIIHILVARWKIVSKPFIASIFTIFLGYLAGMPYLFIHFEKILMVIPQALSWYWPDPIDSNKPLLLRLLPSYFHIYHLKFLIADGLLIIPFFASLVGIIIGFKKYTLQSLLLMLIPITNGIFITFYVSQIYEQLTLPTLPFLAIFISLCLYHLIKLIGKIYNKVAVFIVSIIVLSLAIIPSFINSLQADMDCGKQITDFQARDWIINHIPPGSAVAYHPGTRHPSVEMEWIESTVKNDFSLSELINVNAKYLIAIDGYYGTFIEWSYDLLLPQKHIIENQYAKLAVDEIKDNSILLAEFKKHKMCVGNKIEIYKLPVALLPAKNLLWTYSFMSSDNSNEFSLLKEDEEIEIKKNLDVVYQFKQDLFNTIRKNYNFFYSSPYFSKLSKASEAKKYTAILKLKSNVPDKTIKKDGLIRIDFFDGNKNILKTSLSAKGKISDNFEEIVVTSIAPPNTQFLRIGFQSLVSAEHGSFLLNHINLYED